MIEFERFRDRELLKRFRAGDRDAFSEIYREYNAAVYRFARAMTGDPVKAAEAAQDVFVWLIHHPAAFDPERGELEAFLVGVARKLLKRRHSEERRWAPIEEVSLGVEQAPEAMCDANVLRQAIAALPPRYREVVALCELESRSYEEAASIAECAVGTIRSRLHRARALLARKLLGKGCHV